jgi:phenylalanyl-tRNA synthetase alpha chain
VANFDEALMTDIETLEHELMRALNAAADEAALEAVRVAALGKRGSISALLATLGKMSPEERRHIGPLINGLKDRITHAIVARRDILKDAALERRLDTEAIDVTLPTPEQTADTGRIHPISRVMDEITAIFADMGFAVAEGPDIETDDYNFTKLNFPDGHPAREMHDTFFFNQKPLEVDSCGVLQDVFRGRRRENAVPAAFLSVYRAFLGSRHPVPPRQRRNSLRPG